MIFLLIFGIVVLLVLIAIFYLMLRPIINGAVFFPTTSGNVEVIKRMAHAKSGERVADLGSGDGRILMAFAKDKIEICGYEIDPTLVWRSRRMIRKLGLQNYAKVFRKSFWRRNLSGFNVVIVYGIPYIMRRLERKLKRELKPGSRVISNIYQFPHWKPKETNKEKDVYLYIKT